MNFYIFINQRRLRFSRTTLDGFDFDQRNEWGSIEHHCVRSWNAGRVPVSLQVPTIGVCRSILRIRRQVEWHRPPMLWVTWLHQRSNLTLKRSLFLVENVARSATVSWDQTRKEEQKRIALLTNGLINTCGNWLTNASSLQFEFSRAYRIDGIRFVSRKENSSKT